jgi:exonuclease SbcC
VIIHAIRLKNVKSYGEGPDGTGVTVSFQPGVNRIAGPNGNGKTTIIECLGYALFQARPVFEEKFAVETYLVRHGCKAGEIAVTFSHGGETYRVERGLGPQNRLRAKVVQIGDGSLCAEGDGEVEALLCRLLAVPDAARLPEMFSKLVGVKQGRLALPFDAKPSEAKRFFEPLLEVEVFRQCFDRLKPALDSFEEQRDELRVAAAGVAARIQDRADSPAALARAQAAAAALTAALAAAAAARDAARATRDACEAQEKAFAAAGAARAQAAAAASAATGQRTDAAVRVAEAERAAAAVAEARAAHEAFQAAEDALRRLAERRKERDHLRAARTAADTDAKERRARAQGARAQAAELSEQRAAKEAQRAAAALAVESLRAELEASRAAFEQAQAAARAAADDRREVSAWIQGLPTVTVRLERLARAIAGTQLELGAWDPAQVERARVLAASAAAALRDAEKQHAEAVSRRDSLARQLQQLGDGVCPFLRETCRQFDPAKVQADVSARDAAIAALTGAAASRRAEHTAAADALEALVKAESQLAGARAQQGRDLTAFGEELASAIPGCVASALERLGRWQADLGVGPAVTPVRGAAVTPPSVGAAAAALAALGAEVRAWWGRAALVAQAHLDHAGQEQTARAARAATLETRSQQLATLAEEVRALEARAASRATEADRLEHEAAEREQAVQRHDAALQPHEGLDAEVEARTAACDRDRPGHERYLAARSLADELEPRRTHLSRRREAEATALAALTETEHDLGRAAAAYDPHALTAAREDYEQRLGAATATEERREHARTERHRQEQRVAEWQAACAEQADALERISRHEAAMALTELARRTLQNAAPAVAQHLCDRIAASAQAVFNQINPDPIELSWEAKQYSLRIAPGDRRFAMLSGGEQTKLALAMTLAMVEELSQLRFCVFDEPTYGVDADSRRKLADAILAAQDAAGLEQLLLVSHDDAFDGKIEHAIVLRKSAAHGTAVVAP